MLRGQENQLYKFKYFLCLIWDCSHFGHQLEAHRLERLILGHNGYGSGICGVVTELKVHASWWSAHKVATILWQAQNFLLNLRFIGMSNPGGSTIASAALSLDECLLLLVERVENSLKNVLQRLAINLNESVSRSTHIILDCFLDLAASLADGRWQERAKVLGLLCYFCGNYRRRSNHIIRLVRKL